MQVPDLEFLGDKKGPVIIAAVVGTGIFALARNSAKKPSAAPPVVTTVRPSEGASWDDIMSKRDGGVIGVVGPGEPVPGDSAYDVAVKSGYKGTLLEWIASLRGATGATGAIGAKGATGATGATGARGETGVSSPTPRPDPVAKPVPAKPVPAPVGWKPRYPGEIDSNGKPYTCPPGSFMTTEKGSSNHVCQMIIGGKQFQVRYKTAPTARYPMTPDAGQQRPATTQTGQPMAGQAEMSDIQPYGDVYAFNFNPEGIALQDDITVGVGDTAQSLATRAYGVPDVDRLYRGNPGKTAMTVGERWSVL